MSTENSGFWQILFFAAAALLVAVQTWRGWRLGALRQSGEIVAILCAYGAAWLAGPLIGRRLQFLSLPHQALIAVGGCVAGVIIYLAARAGSERLAVRMEERSPGERRVGGAIAGAVFSLFLLWILTFMIRLGGALAKASVTRSEWAQASGHAVYRNPNPAGPSWMRGLVHLKAALEEGATGAVVKGIDPLPVVAYSMVEKIGAMLSNEQSVERFLSYPGIRPIAEHPRILALRDDPRVVRDVQTANFLNLIHNANVVQAANDEGVLLLLKQLDVQKALDYALQSADKSLERPTSR